MEQGFFAEHRFHFLETHQSHQIGAFKGLCSGCGSRFHSLLVQPCLGKRAASWHCCVLSAELLQPHLLRVAQATRALHRLAAEIRGPADLHAVQTGANSLVADAMQRHSLAVLATGLPIWSHLPPPFLPLQPMHK